MPYATCKFPLVKEFKELGNKNKFIGFIDSVLSGYGQIAFSDNPWSGLLLIIGCFIGSTEQAVAGLVAAIVSTAFAYLIGTNQLLIRMGLYTFNGALAGLGIPLFIFPGQEISISMLIYSAIAGILCVVLTAGLSYLLASKNVPSLALPYCITLFILIPASLQLGTMHPSTSVIPYLGELTNTNAASFTSCGIGEFITAVFNNMAEIIWQANIWSGVLYLVAVLISSRIDALSAIVASVIATLVAMALGLSMDGILIGLYGYNAVLLMQAIFGRGYDLSIKTFIFSVVLAVISVFITLWMQIIFAPLGAAVCAFPYAITAVIVFMAREALGKFTYNEPLKWGVPETIAKNNKES